MKKSLEKLISEINKTTAEKERLRQKWQQKLDKASKDIESLEKKLSSASEDFDSFRNIRAELNNAKEYKTELEKKLKELSVPTAEEREQVEGLKNKAAEELKAGLYDLGAMLEKEGEKILQGMADTFSDQQETDKAIKKLFETYGIKQDFWESLLYQYKIYGYTSPNSLRNTFENISESRKKGAAF